MRRAAACLRTDALARGASINLVCTGGQAVVSLLATLIAASFLGPGGIGILSLGLLLAEFTSTVDNLPSQGFVRDHAGRPSDRQVGTILVTKGLLGAASTVVLLLLSPWLAIWLDVPVVVPRVFALIPTTSILSSVAVMTWEARRQMTRRNITPLAEGVTRLALYSLVAAGVAAPFAPVTSLAIMTVLASLTASLVGAYLLRHASWRGFDAGLARAWLSFGLRTQGTGVMQKTIFWFDILLIDLFLGHATQGLYKSAYQLVAYLALGASTVTIMMYPSLAAAQAVGDERALRATFSRAWFYSLGVALPGVVILAAAPDLVVRVLLGEAFAPAAWMLRALALLFVPAIALLPFEQFFPAIGRPGTGLVLAIVQVVTNVSLNLALIPPFGVMGAIVATAATFTIGLALAAVLFRRAGHDLPRWRDVAEAWAAARAAREA